MSFPGIAFENGCGGGCGSRFIKGMDGAIGNKTVTYDFARLMEGAKEVKCSAFADAVVGAM